ncbi:MAG: hypothetical protein K9L17_00740 [Clostridiales bacterium]|nr:hypothetical protein [Clostridiales bacterium]MCF8021219.1 hypothetical protein [Clostridiales bacterium]
MLAFLAGILIGWPAILSSLFISLTGIIKKQPVFLILGGIIITGFAWYLTGSPALIYKKVGYSLPFFHFAAAFLVRSGYRWAAFLFLMPHAFVAAYLGIK